ncbi:MAG: hypothetical protein R3C99_05225 [Pirellulaceae bacterium]
MRAARLRLEGNIDAARSKWVDATSIDYWSVLAWLNAAESYWHEKNERKALDYLSSTIACAMERTGTEREDGLVLGCAG